jgi:hypothetical protein
MRKITPITAGSIWYLNEKMFSLPVHHQLLALQLVHEDREVPKDDTKLACYFN